MLALYGAGCMAGCRVCACACRTTCQCTREMQLNCDILSPMGARGFARGGGLLGPGHVAALTCARVGAACTVANKISIAAAGGVAAIIQGMQAHVGVVGVQEHGTGALTSLAVNGV